MVQTIRADLAQRCAWAEIDEKYPLRLAELRPETSAYMLKLLRHRAVRILIASEAMAEQIAVGCGRESVGLGAYMRADLLRETARQLRRRPEAQLRLEEILDGNDRQTDPSADSLLLAIDPFWRPRDARGLKLTRASLAEARWPRVNLRGVEMWSADPHGADLSDANLTSAPSRQRQPRRRHADRREPAPVEGTLNQLFARGAPARSRPQCRSDGCPIARR